MEKRYTWRSFSTDTYTLRDHIVMWSATPMATSVVRRDHIFSFVADIEASYRCTRALLRRGEGCGLTRTLADGLWGMAKSG